MNKTSMQTIHARIIQLAAALLLCASQFPGAAFAVSPLPPAIRAFCDMALGSDIARKGQDFNKSGMAGSRLPKRRIIAYLTGKHYDYLWYEHAGNHYHQHLVKFSNTRPYEVKVSYVFDSTRHKDIRKLIQDVGFLNSHMKNACGL